MTIFNTSVERQTAVGRTFRASFEDLRMLRENLIVLCLHLARLEGCIGTLRPARKYGPLSPTSRKVARLRKKAERFSSFLSSLTSQITLSDVYMVNSLRTDSDLLLWWVLSSTSLPTPGKTWKSYHNEISQ